MTQQIQISFEESGETAARIGAIFGLSGDDLKARMEQIAAAALEEYELAFSGRFPSTAREQRELRLRLLYEHLPEGLPTDDQIGQLFQMTRTQVATLIAGTRARYGREIEGRLTSEAKKALSEATKVDKDTVSIFVPDSLGRYLSDLIAQSKAPPLDRRKDASQTYYAGRTTIRALCEKLGLEPAATVKAIKWE